MAVPLERVSVWIRDAARKPPDISESAAPRLSNIRSITAITAEDGMGLRMMSGSGHLTEVYLNPVVAQELMRIIGVCGTESGWLSDDLEVNVAEEA